MGKRADLYMGMGQAINELRRLQDHLMRFGLSEEQQLEGIEQGVKYVVEYLSQPETWYGFDDLVTPADPQRKEQIDGR